MPPRPGPERRRARFAAVCLAGGSAAIIALHWLRPGLDPASRAVSDYVHGPFGAVATFSLLALAAGGWALARAVRRGTGARIGSWLLRLFAVAMALAAFFPVPEPGSEGNASVHGAAAVVAFTSLTFAMLVLYRAFGRRAHTRALRTPTLVMGGAALLMLLGAGTIDEDRLGFWERVFLADTLGWMLLVALVLWRGPRVSP